MRTTLAAYPPPQWRQGYSATFPHAWQSMSQAAATRRSTETSIFCGQRRAAADLTWRLQATYGRQGALPASFARLCHLNLVDTTATRHASTSAVSARSGGRRLPAVGERHAKGKKSMLINRASEIKTSEITDKTLYRERRRFLRLASTAALLGATARGVPSLVVPGAAAQTGQKVSGVRQSPLSTDEARTP